MVTVEELVVKIQAEISNLEKNLEKAKKELKKLETTTAKVSKTSTANFKSVSASLASLASVARVAYATIATYAAYMASSQMISYAKMAARGEQLEESFRRLAEKYGFSADAILADLDRLAKGTIQKYDLILAANRALLLGIPADKLDELMKIAIVRARAMGLSYTQAFNDIVTGIGRASPMILDNLGIIAKAEEAYKEYAETIGKSADELTSQEQKLALLNYVITHNIDLLKEYDEIQDEVTDAEQWEQVSRAISDVKYQLGELVGPTILKGINALREALEDLRAYQKRMKKVGTLKATAEFYVLMRGGIERDIRGLINKLFGVELPKSPFEILAEKVSEGWTTATKQVTKYKEETIQTTVIQAKLKSLTSAQLTKLRELGAEYLKIKKAVEEATEPTAEQLQQLEEAKRKLEEYIETLAKETGIRKEILALVLKQSEEEDKKLKNLKASIPLLKKAVNIYNELNKLEKEGTVLSAEQNATLEWAEDIIREHKIIFEDLIAKKLEGKELTQEEIALMNNLSAILNSIASTKVGVDIALNLPGEDRVREAASQLAEQFNRYMEEIGAKEKPTPPAPPKLATIEEAIESAQRLLKDLTPREQIIAGVMAYAEAWGLGMERVRAILRDYGIELEAQSMEIGKIAGSTLATSMSQSFSENLSAQAKQQVEAKIKTVVDRTELEKFLSESIEKVVNIKFNIPELKLPRIPDLIARVRYAIDSLKLPQIPEMIARVKFVIPPLPQLPPVQIKGALMIDTSMATASLSSFSVQARATVATAIEYINTLVDSLMQRLEALNAFSLAPITLQATSLADAFDKVAQKVDALSAKLDALNGKTVRVNVDVSSNLANLGVV